jgi:ribose/xylose/arabinose/galactoside ABC-type transport system permease subunit
MIKENFFEKLPFAVDSSAKASVAIGGTLLAGGVGKTLCGVLIIGFIKNIINLQGDVNSYWQKIVMGLILLLVVIVQNKTFRKGTV